MKFNTYLLPTFLAVLLHAVIFSLLFQSWFGHAAEDQVVVPRHVKAQIVDLSSQRKAEEKKQAEKRAQQNKRQQEEAKKKQQAEKKKTEALKKEQARKKADARKKDEARKKEVARKKQQAEKKKAEALKKEQAKKKAEAKKKENARKIAEALKKEQAKKKELARKKAEAAKKEEARKKAEAPKKEQARKKEEARKKEQAKKEQERREQVLAAAMAEEERYQQEASDQQSVASYKDYIVGQVTRNWRRSASARNGMEVLLTVHLLPTGEVDNVYVAKGSGDDRFDQDALRAVKRAERFPELQQMESVLFDRYFRKLNLKFRPEDLRR